MDAAVAAFEQHGVTHIDGVPTLTVPLATFSGRQNDETFAKEVCFLHDDRYVATGGDCGRVYVWGTASGRLVYRDRGDGSIVNVVCPHPSLPLLAVSGIDDDVKLFGLGDSRPPTLRRWLASMYPDPDGQGWMGRSAAPALPPPAIPYSSMFESPWR